VRSLDELPCRWFEPNRGSQKHETTQSGGFLFWLPSLELGRGCWSAAACSPTERAKSAGEEPKRRRWRMKRGEEVAAVGISAGRQGNSGNRKSRPAERRPPPCVRSLDELPCRWFEPNRGSQEKRPFSNGLFSIQSEGLACNLTAGEYVIAEGVWHHASACILLRIDYIQHFVLIPYRRQATDFIHAFRRDLAQLQSCTLTQKSLNFKGFSCFLGVKNNPFHHCTFS